MRPTVRLYRGFVGRSMDELKRYTQIVVNLEAIRGPQGPYTLQTFDTPESVQECKLLSDADIGGFSKSLLDWHASEASPKASTTPKSARSNPHLPQTNGYARFHGVISTELPKDRPEIQRTGYAAWRTPDRKPTVFGRSYWNIDPYDYLAMRIKSDGRSYFINVQTDSIVPTDLHQHRLFAKRPGQWETVLIHWNDFVRTNHGMAIEPQTEILRQKVKSIGVGLTDRRPGPFELCIERIWATNDPAEADIEDGPSMSMGSLKNRLGEKVSWTSGSSETSQKA
ncbi:hypothetical protein jhhlp_003977 [Lomentospora prolificans]|uniref:NADH:ubiquinone oxidoreductase intermediate-associated protein 30 domain-containing protein n=1 Tax=Lomentospora prolificans TaxID=41688 RepID=A0A2N3NAA2_9PEZI|nr:hypothetical protein jhhlp_003977 [Lomentospora prolificans]